MGSHCPIRRESLNAAIFPSRFFDLKTTHVLGLEWSGYVWMVWCGNLALLFQVVHVQRTTKRCWAEIAVLGATTITLNNTT